MKGDGWIAVDAAVRKVVVGGAGDVGVTSYRVGGDGWVTSGDESR